MKKPRLSSSQSRGRTPQRRTAGTSRLHLAKKAAASRVADTIRERALETLRKEFPAARPATPKAPLPAPGVPSSPPSPAPQPTGKPPAPPVEDPIPARMLNEFVYCPRLFYYEQVEGVFVKNADVARGQLTHKRVDKGKGALPAPKRREPIPDSAKEGEPREISEPETIHSRSVQLGSDRLGVTAKLDLVESSAAREDLFEPLTVVPVDYKVGAPREGTDGFEIWDADKMQLGLQILLLRDNRYRCDEGVIYYRATRQRVRLPMTDVLERWIVDNIARARETMRGPIPPPLDNSPKCPRCSLVTVCLPDETNLLRSSPETGSLDDDPDSPAKIRRLIAARDDKRALYLNTPGLHIGRSGDVLQVREKKELKQEIRLNDVHHVALFGNIQISTQTVQQLCRLDIPLTWFSMGGWFYGSTRGHSLKNVFLRIEQFRTADDPGKCLQLARAFVRGKIHNQRTLLMRNHIEPPPEVLRSLRGAARSCDRVQSLDELLGKEGAAAALYFKHFQGMIKTAEPGESTADNQDTEASPFNFDFNGRNRRPPTDPVNALLSLAYSLLAKDCAAAAHAVGFDPYVGFFHRPRFGRPAIALDIMEEFRPLIADSTVITAINTRVIDPGGFVRAGNAVNLSTAGRKAFFMAYERRMGTLINHPVFGYKVSYRRAIELQFRLLARALTDEIPDYIPFRTR